jgi:hypothetical protein
MSNWMVLVSAFVSRDYVLRGFLWGGACRNNPNRVEELRQKLELLWKASTKKHLTAVMETFG